ncbi:Uncharacterised protein [uncultured archaeon]|nr:Uncharacterised protein [uncultured archaeon]
MGKYAAYALILSSVALFSYFLLHESGWAGGSAASEGAEKGPAANPPNHPNDSVREDAQNATAQPLDDNASAP